MSILNIGFVLTQWFLILPAPKAFFVPFRIAEADRPALQAVGYADTENRLSVLDIGSWKE